MTPSERTRGADADAALRLDGDVSPGDLDFDHRGLVPAVVQTHDTGEVLMVAYMSEESLGLTLERGEAVFWSRSRQELWHKGSTSGNTQPVVEIRYDCDADCLLVLVDVDDDNVACHTGDRTCFHRSLAVRAP